MKTTEVLTLNRDEKQLVVKGNRLIEASYRLTTQEQRIILLMASKIKAEDKDFRTYRIGVKDFYNLIGTETKAGYERADGIIKKLMERTLRIRRAKSTLRVSWLSSAEYFDGKGYMELSFDPKLKSYMLQLQNFFTQYQLKNVIRLKRAYSVRVYELLKQYEKIGERRFSLNELKRILGIKASEYKFYGDLKRRVLRPAQKELEKGTDIRFEFKEQKQGRKVIGLIFRIWPNRPNKEDKETKVEITNPELYQSLQDYFLLSPTQAQEVMAKYSEERILENLTYVEDKHKQGLIENIGPYTLKAINEDFRLQISLFEVEKDKNEAEEQKQEAQKRALEKAERNYDRYKKSEVEKLKEGLDKAELETIESKVRDEFRKKHGKGKITENKMVEIGVIDYLTNKAGIPSFNEWETEKKVS